MRGNGLDEQWWMHEYSDDVHSHLLKRELRCPIFHMQSPQLPYRKPLLIYMKDVCDRLQFCKQVRHLAIYILDIFMDNYMIHMDHLQLIVIGCLIVAVKVDEQDALIPRMSDFNVLMGNNYHLKDFVTMEVIIMEFLRWHLLIPTAATFADYYGRHAVSETDYYCNEPLQCFDDAKKQCLLYIEFILELSLQNAAFRMFRSSVVAASCVALSRICLFITPTWPQYLRDITHYELDDLKSCLELMIKILNQDKFLSKRIAGRMLENINCAISFSREDDESGSNGSNGSTPSSTKRCKFR